MRYRANADSARVDCQSCRTAAMGTSRRAPGNARRLARWLGAEFTPKWIPAKGVFGLGVYAEEGIRLAVASS